jgi:hypothetical protein
MAFRLFEAQVFRAGGLVKSFYAAVEGNQSLTSRLLDGAEKNPEHLLGRSSCLDRVAR